MPQAPHHDEERPDLELVPPPNPAGWRRERIGWALLAILLAAALLGVFGAGPLSRTSISVGGVQLAYDRFVRTSAPTVLELVVQPEANGSEAIVALDHAYLERVRVREIVPQPKRAVAQPDAVAFVFEAAGAGAPVRAWFNLTFETSGLAVGRLTAGGETIRFRQLAYP
jgi:hypothetical protein